jgi:hypothetical protein
VSGITEKVGDPSKVIIGYGINDCISRFVKVDKSDVVWYCTIVGGIYNWFLIDDEDDRDSTDPIIHVGWFQVLKDYLPQ